jgi:hypothetical protein
VKSRIIIKKERAHENGDIDVLMHVTIEAGYFAGDNNPVLTVHSPSPFAPDELVYDLSDKLSFQRRLDKKIEFMEIKNKLNEDIVNAVGKIIEILKEEE